MNEKFQQNAISQVVWPWLGKKNTKNRRQSLLIALPVLVVAWLIAFIFYYLNHQIMSVIVAAVSLVVFFSSQFFPAIFAVIESFFKKISFIVGKLIGWITLTPFFYLFCTLMRCIQFIRKNDLMNRKIDLDAGTYWQEVDKENGVEQYLRQF